MRGAGSVTLPYIHFTRTQAVTLGVGVGTLDNQPEWLVPDGHIFTSTKLAWYSIPQGAVAAEGQYDREKVLTKENQERLAKAREKVLAEGK